MYIEQLYTSCLAEAAYYIESNGEAAIIDPLRETGPYLKLASERNARIRYIFETHFHADFVSGHIDLSRITGAPIIYGPDADTAYEIKNAHDGEIFPLGNITIQALHTPGHTPESTCYLLRNEKEEPHAIFTGDTLFVGDVGRPDLLDGIMSGEELAGMLYQSLNEKIKPLPDHVIVYPAHGPGSACGKNIGKETYSTIGAQKKTNYALRAETRESFIEQVTHGMLPPPAYFFEDARINKEGYRPLTDVVKQSLVALDQEEIQDMQDEVVILDTRDADAFEKGHIPGSVNIGLGGQYAVWIGTLFPIHQPFVLVADQGHEEEAVIRLARVGFENVRGYLKHGMEGWSGRVESVTSIEPEELAERMDGKLTVIDVRKPGEYESGHAEGALHYPLNSLHQQLPDRKDQPLYVYCAGGYRSMIACSLLKSRGYTNTINVRQGFKAFPDAGVPVRVPAAQRT